MASWGFGYPAIKELNSSIIYASITGYGQTSIYADAAGHDINYLARSGLLAQNMSRSPSPVPSVPAVPGFQTADVAGGSYVGAMAILAAIIKRDSSPNPKPVHLDIDMTAGVSSLATVPFSISQTGLNDDTFNVRMQTPNHTVTPIAKNLGMQDELSEMAGSERASCRNPLLAFFAKQAYRNIPIKKRCHCHTDLYALGQRCVWGGGAIYSLSRSQVLNGRTAVNYAVYGTKDGKFLAVGALEMKFWRRVCDVIDKPAWKKMNQLQVRTGVEYKGARERGAGANKALLPVVQRESFANSAFRALPLFTQPPLPSLSPLTLLLQLLINPPAGRGFPVGELEDIFRSKTRGEWDVIFDAADCCVTGVLELNEIAKHPYHVGRGSFEDVEGADLGMVKSVGMKIIGADKVYAPPFTVIE